MKIYWPNHWKMYNRHFSFISIEYHREEYPEEEYVNNFMFILFGIGINFAFKGRR